MSMPRPQRSDRDRQSRSERFARSLARLAGREAAGEPPPDGAATPGRPPDRAALATLRRGLGKAPGTVAAVNQYVVPYLPPEPSPNDDAYYLVAALFGWHPWAPWNRERGRWRSNLGVSFAWAAHAKPGEPDRSAGIQRRFIALLSADRADLDSHLRHAVQRFASHEVPVDWALLLDDILAWDAADRRVQRRWARAYWGAAPDAEEAPDSGQPAVASV